MKYWLLIFGCKGKENPNNFIISDFFHKKIQNKTKNKNKNLWATGETSN